MKNLKTPNTVVFVLLDLLKRWHESHLRTQERGKSSEKLQTPSIGIWFRNLLHCKMFCNSLCLKFPQNVVSQKLYMYDCIRIDVVFIDKKMPKK